MCVREPENREPFKILFPCRAFGQLVPFGEKFACALLALLYMRCTGKCLRFNSAAFVRCPACHFMVELLR